MGKVNYWAIFKSPTPPQSHILIINASLRQQPAFHLRNSALPNIGRDLKHAGKTLFHNYRAQPTVIYQGQSVNGLSAFSL
jgi:hypothetical protein